ncbi:hypothetical protein [Pelagibacterium lacus]|uniref:Uncharacterized protein n=1 Tax=Pelagibacterium lacus TaxID=2282655 RepID=A0A369W3H3_9HYPH|nr:hypothetical protein [Pelagibacterium lacus]RDE09226.1 hypothetical protein DVH29_07115 [Pelagibacterium lacus]
MTAEAEIVERSLQADGGKTQRVLIPSLPMLERQIRAVAPAAFRDLAAIGAELAREHGADSMCMTTAERHLKVIAVIAHSAVTLRDPDAVPFWRVVDTQRPGSDRLAGGRGFIVAQRAREAKNRA